MLKYKLNIKNGENKVIDVKYESLYYSLDGTTITGVTDPSYGLSEIQTITVISNETKICSISARDVMRCGYLIYNKNFNIEDYGETVGILYTDGQYYCANKMFSLKERPQDGEYVNPFITVNEHEYEIGEWVENGNNPYINWYASVNIPVKYWVYDEKVTINNITYDVIIDNKNQMLNTDDYYPYIILNDMSLDDIDRVLYVMDWEYTKRKKVTLFEIYDINKPFLHIKECSCVKPYEYFDSLNENGEYYRVYAEQYDDKIDFFAAMFSANKQISIEWKNVGKSNVIDLYVSENINDFPLNARILVTPIEGGQLTLKGEKVGDIINFNYYNRVYTSDTSNTKDFVVINDVEYEIYEQTYGEGNGAKQVYYIIFNSIPLTIRKTNGNTKAYIQNRFDPKTDTAKTEVEFTIKKYPFLVIDDKYYKIEQVSSTNNYICKVNSLPPFYLQITNRFSNNVLRCKGLKENDLSNLFQAINLSHNDFNFQVISPIFDMNLVAPLDADMKNYVASDVILRANYNSFLLPIKFENDVTINLHKEYISHKNYVEAETSDLINRIVDMEKDIYYPAYAEQKGNELVMTLCHQIQIDLHFRSRDLNTWVVNDENNNVDYINHPTTWNIFDKYRYSNDNAPHKEFYPILNLKGDNQFFPPSDLLYFLKFTNDDVFYQKQKIGKSFLRLSFYDSPDPKNQNLLHSSTIFMSETLLYQKYINALKSVDEYVTIKERGFNREEYNNETESLDTTYTVSENNVVKNIGVDTEPCENNKKHTLTFDENKRLSSSFIIKNRNAAIDSCEGFYLYLFKEYSNGLHERSIYMKVQFNHAGEGKTINFMQLYHQNADGSKAMLNWSSKHNYEKYKDGCTLQELYEHLYIEIKVKYDIKNHRFCYYLPQWMCNKNSDKHTMRLSLFEVKLKDESR